MALNLHLLRIFYTVVDTQSFSKAAETLFISQPAVSKAVRELERQLDLALIERGARPVRGVHLTEAGRALHEHARSIFALERVALEDVRARVGLQRGSLTIGASTTVGGFWLPRYLSAFMRRFPEVPPDLRIGNTHTISQALLDCHLDLAVVEGSVEDPRIASTHWHDDALLLVAAAGSELVARRRVAPADLSANVWLLREPGSGTREVADRFLREHGVTPRHTVEIGSNAAIARVVAEGAGIALLPAMMVADLIALKRVMRVPYRKDESVSRPLFVLQLKDRPLSPAATAFRALLDQSPSARL
ncbi:LysR family transcriptional regulator [Imbroritus primus]|uniref:LysR family transcriptional regulator n=1 Tax=Imbroritus primus TaxID=3058603 RepID=UPI003D16213C